jgi:hypothetical protein
MGRAAHFSLSESIALSRIPRARWSGTALIVVFKDSTTPKRIAPEP